MTYQAQQQPAGVIALLALAITLFTMCTMWLIGDQNRKHEQVAQTLMPECRYLGQLRNARDVHFFDCDGRIEMRKQ